MFALVKAFYACTLSRHNVLYQYGIAGYFPNVQVFLNSPNGLTPWEIYSGLATVQSSNVGCYCSIGGIWLEHMYVMFR